MTPIFSRAGRSHLKDKGWLLHATPAICQAVRCSVLPSALIFRGSFLSGPWNLWHKRNRTTFLFSLFEWSIEFTDINIYRHICIYELIHIHKYIRVYTNIFCLYFPPKNFSWSKIKACLSGKAKAHLKLNLAMGKKDNKKDFYMCINSKWKTGESVCLLLNGNGDLMTQDMEKAEMLNTILILIFTGKTSLQQFLSWDMWDSLEHRRLNISRRGSGQGTVKLKGHTQPGPGCDAPIGTEGAGCHHCSFYQ